MTAKSESQVHSIPPYGVAMSDAIASGDAAKMSAARDAAFAHLATAADVSRLLPELEKAIKSKGGVIRPLYAVTIQEAVARGDASELSRLKAEVASYGALLNSGAGASVGNATVMPYGVAIQDAKGRGDEAEVQRLTALAQSLLAQLNATK